MYLASIDFGTLATSTHLALLAPLLLTLAVLLPTVLLGFVGQLLRGKIISEPVEVVSVTRDGQAHALVGRVYHFGQRSESEDYARRQICTFSVAEDVHAAALRARLGAL